MNTAFILYDLRRSLPVLAFLLCGLTGLTLLQSGPLSSSPLSLAQIAGAAAGLLLAIRLMTDTGGTQSFVFSCGVTRRRLFLLRLLTGAAVLTGISLAMWLLLKLGFRSSLHRLLWMSDAVFYPMSERFEASVVGASLRAGLHAFCLASFYMTWRGLSSPALNNSSSGIVRLFLLEGPAILVCLYVLLMTTAMSVESHFSEGAGLPGTEPTGMTQTAMLLMPWTPALLSTLAVAGVILSAKHLEAE